VGDDAFEDPTTMALRSCPADHLRPTWRAEDGDPRSEPSAMRRRLATAVATSRSSAALQVVNIAISVYAVASIALVATHHVGLTSEHAILLVLVAGGLVPRLRPLVRDWLPFLFIAVMFEDMGALQPLVAGSVHSIGPAVLERDLLGVNAAPWLQEHLGGLLGPVWWQIPLVAEYLAHFAAPLVAGGYLWWRHRQRFGGFVGAYTLVMAAGFATYLIFPEMPPWIAAQHGIIEPVQRTVVLALDHLGAIGSVYSGADPFPDGAMPSLHVAVPTVIALTLLTTLRGRLRWLWLLYPVTIGFAVVDLGEHYVADVVVGLAVGALCWAVVDLGPALAARLGGSRPVAVAPVEVDGEATAA
jgi:hypothetical protein